MYKYLAYLLIILFSYSAIAESQIDLDDDETKTIFYKNMLIDGHRIHLLSFNTSDNEIRIVKAHNIVNGREKLDSIAKRNYADAAINASFFEMNNENDGAPADILKIDGKWVGYEPGKYSIIAWNDGNFIFDILNIELKLCSLQNDCVKIDHINKKDMVGVTLFNDFYGKYVLESLPKYPHIVTDIQKQPVLPNDGEIPIGDGFVAMIPKTNKDLIKKMWGDYKIIKTEFNLKYNTNLNIDKFDNIVSGAPLLIAEGKPVASKYVGDLPKNFVNHHHARTAICKIDNTFNLIVIDNDYSNSFYKMTINDVYETLKSKGYSRDWIYKAQYSEIQKVITKDNKITSKGMSLKELTDYLLTLKCDWAINLDGGGSSSMYYEGKIVNNPTGDKDEGNGIKALRRISDAIIIKKKWY